MAAEVFMQSIVLIYFGGFMNNKTIRYGFFSTLVIELTVVLALIWQYGSDWGNDKILVLVMLVPLLLAVYETHRVSLGRRQSLQSDWRPTGLMIATVAFGLLGMIFAWVIGPHLAGSVVIYVTLIQAGLFWFALWKSRIHHEQGNTDGMK